MTKVEFTNMVLAVDVRGVSKQYRTIGGRKQAVDNASLTLKTGQTLGLIGANGAGKSTLIKCILGVITPQKGEVTIFGRQSILPTSRRDVAFVAETSVLHEGATPLQLIQLSASIAGKNFVETKVDEWLDKLGVLNVRNKKIKGMSKGMAQRVALANALYVQPKLLILDEPLSGLDPMGRRSVVDILEEYKSLGGTLFFTSHVLHDVERLADQYCIIHDGKIITQRSREDILDRSNLVIQSRMINSEVKETVVQRDKFWVTMKELESSSHEILSVKPELSLERYFYDTIAE